VTVGDRGVYIGELLAISLRGGNAGVDAGRLGDQQGPAALYIARGDNGGEVRLNVIACGGRDDGGKRLGVEDGFGCFFAGGPDKKKKKQIFARSAAEARKALHPAAKALVEMCGAPNAACVWHGPWQKRGYGVSGRFNNCVNIDRPAVPMTINDALTR